MKPDELEDLLSREIRAPDSAVQRTLQALKAAGAPPAGPSPRRAPLPWHQRYLAALATGVACLVLLAFGAGLWLGRRGAPADPATTEVRFTLDAPAVRTAAVMGDFTEWNPVAMRKVSTDGRWEVRVKVRPQGRYRYVFVLDEKELILDPKASMRADDGFGNVNSVLKI